MGWRERLMGKTIPPAQTTSEPESRSNWEVIAGRQRRASAGVGDLFRSLRGKSASPVRVCSDGHVVPEGSTTCSYGHYVG